MHRKDEPLLVRDSGINLCFYLCDGDACVNWHIIKKIIVVWPDVVGYIGKSTVRRVVLGYL
ncbi:hypothetical protein D3C87_1391810 [compost metagenome]